MAGGKELQQYHPTCTPPPTISLCLHCMDGGLLHIPFFSFSISLSLSLYVPSVPDSFSHCVSSRTHTLCLFPSCFVSLTLCCRSDRPSNVVLSLHCSITGSRVHSAVILSSLYYLLLISLFSDRLLPFTLKGDRR